VIAGLPRLHAVTDDRVIAEGGVVQRAAAMAEAAGPSLAVHLRSTTLEGGAMTALARELAQVLRPHGSWLVVNGRADVARIAGARAVVSGRGALAVREMRRVAPGLLVMRSVHDERELGSAITDEADVLVVSGASHTAEPALVRAAAESAKPVIAIGDIRPESVAPLRDAGAWGVAAIRALWDAEDARVTVRAFLQELPRDTLLGITLNGAPTRARAGTLAALLGDLGLDARAIVVEHNRRIVRRGDLDQATLAEGDNVELVHFVGGG
jgi:thiamine biosynthesis protein ThiS